jgi:SanA protein
MPLSTKSRRWLLRSLWAALAAVLAVIGLNVWMTARASDRIFTDPAKAPATNVALVLGTAEKIGNYTNVHFRVRMDAAAQLYKAGKVKHLLLSGDNSRPGYDEPGDMKAALISRGVPAEAMTCDYAGFRTLDSIVRAKEVFGVRECVIISDDFHLARALWLADHHDVKATAFYSDAVRWRTSFNSRSREWLARVLALMDGITGTRPKFGGEKVALPIQP